MSERGYEIFELGDVELQSGVTFPNAELAYKTYGTLSSAKDNVIVYPSRFGGSHIENEIMIGEGRALDPARWFIVVPNAFGNGFSSSPSNAPPPFEKAGFPFDIRCAVVVDCSEQLLSLSGVACASEDVVCRSIGLHTAVANVASLVEVEHVCLQCAGVQA